jgi:formate hydrogenlyase transcriptional activator
MHRRPPQVPEAAWRALETWPWPGNVRELENFLQRALILSPGPELALPELSAPDRRGSTPAAGGGHPPAPGEAHRTAPPPAAPPGRFDDEVKSLLERALRASAGRVYGPRGAAARLGLKPTTLQGKMRRYRVSRPDGGGP